MPYVYVLSLSNQGNLVKLLVAKCSIHPSIVLPLSLVFGDQITWEVCVCRFLVRVFAGLTLI